MQALLRLEPTTVRGVEFDDDAPAERTTDPTPAPAGDRSGSAPIPPQLRGNPYRLAFVGGDYTPPPGERLEPAQRG